MTPTHPKSLQRSAAMEGLQMHVTDDSTLTDVIEVLARTLGIEDRAKDLGRATGLFGELPELDSLGVVELAAALEDHFDIVIDDDDFTGEVFESVGTLTDFISSRSSA